MNNTIASPFLTVEEPANYLRPKNRTLGNMLQMRTGPVFQKHGGRIYYHEEELTTWSLDSRVHSTTEY